MRRQGTIAKAAMIALMAAVALTACGRKGSPVLPPPKTDEFPHPYPKTTDPQTGVFN